MTTTNVTAAVDVALSEAVDAIHRTRKQIEELNAEREALATRIAALGKDEVYYLGKAHALQALIAKAQAEVAEVPSAGSDETSDTTPQGGAALDQPTPRD